MAQTYTWQTLITDAGSGFGKGIPLTKVTPQIADMVSADMWIEYPWKESITTSGNGTIALLDSTQDYPNVPPNIMRLTKAHIIRLDVTPNEDRDLDISFDLGVDLYPRSYVGIRTVCLEKALGVLRLESSVNVPVGVSLELRVEYQINPTKVVALSQGCWFDDRYIWVAMEGLLYWVYKLADDPRAGSVQSDGMGRQTYSGQYAAYKAALMRMKNAEDYGKTEFVFPHEPMGLPRDSNALNIFGNW